MTDLSTLLSRVESGSGADRELDAEVALALGWRVRRVTGLGLRGRTPGSDRWFDPDRPFFNPDGRRYGGSSAPPNFTGPRGRIKAAALIRAEMEKVK